MDESKNILLNKLQEGALFVKFNGDGSLNEGFFYICPKLKSLCYNVSKKRFQNSTNECKNSYSYFNFIMILYLIDLLKDCEVRAGLKSDTWIKVLRTGKVREQQVRDSLEKKTTTSFQQNQISG
jgi:hypothetical protein